MIRAVFFDMDGVLIDAKEWHYEALNKALGLFGMPIDRQALGLAQHRQFAPGREAVERR